MSNLKANITAVLILFLSQSISAQNVVNENENASLLHQNGQIYLVVLVLLTIFAGIIFYLVRLEKKISKLEKKN